ncbi:MAG: ribonuclease [Solirubrobacterales bacterium]|nr:ribonuclease [Solirubrobacterales bacterium]
MGLVEELAERARATGKLGIDTEFMGEGRYRALLCLVQVAVDDGDRVEVLDPLEGGLDPQPLAAVLADPEIEIVMHAGRQDVALLRRVWETDVTNVFDTQIAAGFGGLRAQLGYEPLLSEVIGVKLRKSASFTRWDARPLSPEQLEYAREDVLHLLQLAQALQDRLSEMGRLEWAREECRFLEDATDVRDLDTVFERLPRINSLDPAQRAVARELAAWREQTAREGDRPIQTVLSDAGLVEVAKRRPKSLERLKQIRGINESTMHRRGKQLIEVVERARDHEPIPVEGERPAQPHPADAVLIALGEALVRARALESKVAYELIAAKADLQRIALAVRDGQPEPDVRTLAGWRRELVGAELLELLEGRLTLGIGPDRRLEVDARPLASDG